MSFWGQTAMAMVDPDVEDDGLTVFCRRHSGDNSPFDVDYDPVRLTVNATLKPGRAPVFTHAAVDGFVAFLTDLDQMLAGGAAIRLIVYRSPHRGVFSVGGDLAMIAEAIGCGSVALERYARRCSEMTYCNWRLVERHAVLTVALVAGDAIGGGLESALSCDQLIAASTATFSMPEVAFGVYPGTGGVPLLTRKCGLSFARRVLASGARYSAADFYAAGAVDEIAPVAEGEDPRAAVETAFAAWRDKAFVSFSAVVARVRAERAAAPLHFDELHANVTYMIDSIVAADRAHAGRIRALAARQARRFAPKD
jgi:DSF synthase